MSSNQSNSQIIIKRRRSVITLETKKQIIIEASQGGKSSDYLSKQFNIESRTIRRILQKKEKILDAINKGNSKITKRASCIQPIKYSNIDEGVLLWVKCMNVQGIQINGRHLKEKALELAKNLNITSFKASEGWLGKFKKRHSIHFKNAKEKNDINVYCLELDEQLENFLAEFKQTEGPIKGELIENIEKEEMSNCASPTIEKILKLCSKNEIEQIEKIETELFKIQEAKEALKILERFVDFYQNEEMKNICGKIDNFLTNDYLQKLKQKTLFEGR